MERAKSKLTAYVQPLSRMEEFSGKNFVNFTKKAGGQFFQYYALSEDLKYTATRYIETEVVFSREIFRKVTYSSVVFPIFVQDFFTSTVSANSNTNSYFGEQIVPVPREPIRTSLSMIGSYFRSLLKESYSPKESIKSSVKLVTAILRTPYVHAIPPIDRFTSKIIFVRDLLNHALIESDMLPDETNRFNSSVTLEKLHDFTRRKLHPFPINFKNPRHLIHSPSLKGARVLSPYTSKFNATANSINFLSKYSGLAVQLSSYSLTHNSNFIVGFSFKPFDIGQNGFLLDTTNLSIRLSSNTLYVTLYGTEYSKELTSVSEQFNTIAFTRRGDLHTVEFNGEMVVSVPKEERDILNVDGSYLNIGNSLFNNSSYMGEYKDFTFKIGDLDDESTKEEVIASHISVESGVLVQKGTEWFSPEGASILLGQDHIRMDGSYTLLSTNREDMYFSIHTNYKIELDFEFNVVPTASKPLQAILYQQTAKIGNYPGLRVDLKIDYNHYDSAVLEVWFGNTVHRYEGGLSVNTRYKLEIIKYFSEIIVLLDNEVASRQLYIHNWDTVSGIPTYLGSRYDGSSAFVGKIYKLEMTNFYIKPDDVDLVSPNKKVGILRFDDGLKDSADPDRVWRLENPNTPIEDSLYKPKNNESAIILREDELGDIGLQDFTLEFVFAGPIPYVHELINEPTLNSILIGSGIGSTNYWSVFFPYDRAAVMPNGKSYLTLTRRNDAFFLYHNGVRIGTGSDGAITPQIGFPKPLQLFTHIGSDFNFGLDALRLVKGEALFYGIPRYDVDKVYYSEEGLPIVPDPDTLVSMNFSNKYPYDRITLEPTASQRLVSASPVVLFNYKSDGVVVLEEKYLDQPLFRFNSNLALTQTESYTLEVLYRAKDSNTPIEGLETDGTTVGFFYKLEIVKSNDRVYVYVDGSFVKVVDNFDTLTISAEYDLLQIRLVSNLVLFNRDHNGEHEVYKDLLVYTASVVSDGCVSLSDANTKQAFTWSTLNSDVINTGRYEITNYLFDLYFPDSVRKEFSAVITARNGAWTAHFDTENGIAANYLESIKALVKGSTEVAVVSPLIHRSNSVSYDVGRNQIENQNGVYPPENLSLKLVDKLRFYKFKSDVKGVRLKPISYVAHNKEPFYLTQTSSYCRFPKDLFFVELGSGKAKLVHDGVLSKNALYIDSNSYLEMSDIPLESNSFSVEGWLKFESSNPNGFITLSNGIESLVINTNNFLPFKPIVGVYFHFKVSVFNGLMVLQINGNKIYERASDLQLAGQCTLSFNTKDYPNNCSFKLDRFILKANVNGVEDFDPLFDLYGEYNLDHNLLDLSKDFVNCYTFDCRDLLDSDGIAVRDDKLVSELSLQSFAGYGGKSLTLTFKKNYSKMPLSLKTVDYHGVLVNQFNREVLSEETSVVIPITLESDNTAKVIFEIDVSEGDQIYDINLLLEQPLYKCYSTSVGDQYVYNEDTNKHIVFKLEKQ